LHRRGEEQGRKKEIQNGVGREPDGLQDAEMILSERQEDADDDQTYGVV
jgi:hypothetical protein